MNKELENDQRLNRKRFTRQFFAGNRLTFFAAVFSTMLLSLGGLVLSWLLQQVVDTATGIKQALPLETLIFITVVFLASATVIGAIVYHSKPRFVARAMRQYKDFAFEELTRKGITAFDTENTSLYLSALSNDANSIEINYLSKLFQLASSCITLVGAVVMMIWYSPLLTMCAFGFSCVPLCAAIISGKRLSKREAVVSNKNESYISTLKDSLNGFSVIKSFKAETQIIQLLSKCNSDVADAKCARDKISVLIQITGMISGAVAQLGVFMVGAYLALSGQGVTPGVVIVFVQLMGYILQPIAEVPEILANRKAANALIDKLADALYANSDAEGHESISKIAHSINLQDVSFAYNGDKQILHNINLTFEAGKCYAIVGASGSGKSTLLSLLMSGHRGFSGDILFDGTDLRRIRTESLYNLISVIHQDVFIFNSSVRDNITMFQEFPKTKVEQAIAMSGLSELIIERGENYLCGENGNLLSGGEKQRISIARSLLRNAQVLLADEFTASLDAETAAQVTRAVLDLHGPTRIIVTHVMNESLLKEFDCIIALKEGEVIEQGTFLSLMEKKGYFYSLFTVSQ